MRSNRADKTNFFLGKQVLIFSLTKYYWVVSLVLSKMRTYLRQYFLLSTNFFEILYFDLNCVLFVLYEHWDSKYQQLYVQLCTILKT